MSMVREFIEVGLKTNAYTPVLLVNGEAASLKPKENDTVKHHVRLKSKNARYGIGDSDVSGFYVAIKAIWDTVIPCRNDHFILQNLQDGDIIKFGQELDEIDNLVNTRNIPKNAPYYELQSDMSWVCKNFEDPNFLKENYKRIENHFGVSWSNDQITLQSYKILPDYPIAAALLNTRSICGGVEEIDTLYIDVVNRKEYCHTTNNKCWQNSACFYYNSEDMCFHQVNNEKDLRKVDGFVDLGPRNERGPATIVLFDDVLDNLTAVEDYFGNIDVSAILSHPEFEKVKKLHRKFAKKVKTTEGSVPFPVEINKLVDTIYHESSLNYSDVYVDKNSKGTKVSIGIDIVYHLLTV